MPTYDFRNKDTGEVFEKVMKIADKEQYLIDNPHLEQTITSAPAFAGDHIASLSKRSSIRSFRQSEMAD